MRRITRVLSFLRFLPDAAYLRAAYFLETGMRLNLSAPETFGEKLQWLKLCMDGRQTARFVDKFEARKIVAGALDTGVLMPILGAWDRAEEIPFAEITRKCVLKCTHGSHCAVTYDPETATDTERREIVRTLRRWTRRSWFFIGREPPYRHIRPQIIAEIYEDDAARDDYKIMCMGGQPMVIQHHHKEDGLHTIDYYDRWGQRIDVHRSGFEPSERRALGALRAAQLRRAARTIAAKIVDPHKRVWPYVRIDFYIVAGAIKFGEITFFDGAGFGRYEPEGADRLLGDMIPIDGLTCPKCLSRMRYNVCGDERQDYCACGYRRTKKYEVSS